MSTFLAILVIGSFIFVASLWGDSRGGHIYHKPPPKIPRPGPPEVPPRRYKP